MTLVEHYQPPHPAGTWPVDPELEPCEVAYLHSLLGKLVQSGSLDLEDVGVGLQQVLPLHAFLPGH